MGFTTACYIRKNSKELQDKLKELGYRICPCCDFENAVWLTTLISTPFKEQPSVHGIGYWDKDFEISTPEQECEDFAKTTSNIDCGTNEELFLALAALRDDSDENQWFIMDVEEYMYINQGDWFLATDRNQGKHIGTQIDPMCCHKATVEEIIKHFKK